MREILRDHGSNPNAECTMLNAQASNVFWADAACALRHWALAIEVLSRRDMSQIDDLLTRWTGAGLLDEATAERIRTFEAEREDAAAAAMADAAGHRIRRADARRRRPAVRVVALGRARSLAALRARARTRRAVSRRRRGGGRSRTDAVRRPPWRRHDLARRRHLSVRPDLQHGRALARWRDALGARRLAGLAGAASRHTTVPRRAADAGVAASANGSLSSNAPTGDVWDNEPMLPAALVLLALTYFTRPRTPTRAVVTCWSGLAGSRWSRRCCCLAITSVRPCPDGRRDHRAAGRGLGRSRSARLSCWPCSGGAPPPGSTRAPPLGCSCFCGSRPSVRNCCCTAGGRSARSASSCGASSSGGRNGSISAPPCLASPCCSSTFRA